MIRTSAITLNASTGTLLVDATRVSSNNPKQVVVQNNDATISIFLGGVTRTGSDLNGGASYTLTTANGIKLVAGASIALTLGPSDSLYAIAASATPAATVLEMGTN